MDGTQPTESPHKGKTGIRRVWNAFFYSIEGLRAQVGATGGSTTVTTVLDVRDGPVAIGVQRASTRAMQRSGVGRDMTGRRRPY